MSYISTRTVKSKKYYYLEESFLWNARLVKESVYIGAISPSNDELFLAQEVLARTCLEKNHIVLVPPLTRHIKNRTAALLERTKREIQTIFSPQSKSAPFLSLVSRNQQDQFTNSIQLLDNEIPPSAKHAKKLWRFYSIELAKNAPLNEAFLRTAHKHLAGAKTVHTQETNPPLMHLLRVWYEEKNDLIHPIELAAKFHAKLITLSPFPTHSRAVARLALNYILQTHGFSFVNVPKRRKVAYEKALLEGNKETYAPLTKLFCEELLKQRKKNN